MARGGNVLTMWKFRKRVRAWEEIQSGLFQVLSSVLCQSWTWRRSIQVSSLRLSQFRKRKRMSVFSIFSKRWKCPERGGSAFTLHIIFALHVINTLLKLATSYFPTKIKDNRKRTQSEPLDGRLIFPRKCQAEIWPLWNENMV